MDNWQDKWLRGYQLKQIIGSGGSSVVYLAYQPAVEREVAIKAISPQFANNPDFVRRFEREAQFIARLEHPHIVPLYDFWRDPHGAYLVMRFLKGGSLKAHVRSNGAWPLPATIKLIDQIASALSTAHQSGIIHQDLKPENILFDEQGNGYLVDFGIAKDVLSNINLSEAGGDKIWGTPAFMAPEQARDNAVTERSDIYSLGLIIYTLLAGEMPYQSPSVTTILRKKLFEVLPPLSLNRPELPDQLNLLIWRATDVLPENRYATVSEFANEFRKFQTETVTVSTPAFAQQKTSSLPVDVTFPMAAHTLITEGTNPYKGLRPFEEVDALDFYGREDLIEKLLARLQSNPRFLTVIGPSGSGKSSVVKAGLLPKLRQGALPESDTWFISTMTPGANPLSELEQALMRVAINAPAVSIAEQLQASGLHKVITQILPGDLLLLIDQFEELFSLAEDESVRRLFINNLMSALNHPQSHLRVILTLRADFYDRPLHYPELGQFIRENTEVILPLSSTEIERSIVEPAKRVGLVVDRALVTAMTDDVQGQPGMLPLLQFALTELYENSQGNRLTVAAYNAVGGVSGALAKRANDLYDQLNPEQQRWVQQIFLRLVSEAATRQRVLRENLTSLAPARDSIDMLLDLFGKHRLLTFDRDPVTRAPTVEIAHEALIHRWEQLREWVDTHRDDLRQYRKLSEAAAEWVNNQRENSFLASGTRLAQFEELAVALNELEQQYLQASIAFRQQNARRRQLFVGVLTVVAISAVIMAFLAWLGQQQAARERKTAETERDRANEQVQISRSRELAVSALTEGGRLDYSLLISLEALRSYDTLEARRSLLLGLVSNPYLVTFLHGHEAVVRTAAVSPDGRMFASAGDDRTIRVWDAETQQLLFEPLTGHTDTIWKVTFSPDGRWLASASHDHTIRLWDLSQSDQPIVLEGHTDKVWDVAFSPDGRWLASASSDGKVLLWDISLEVPVPKTLSAHSATVYTVEFSPDGKLLASGGEDLTIILWDLTDVQTAEALNATILSGHQNWILTLAFSPDGSALASSGPENEVILWDVAARTALGKFHTNHSDWVRDIAFSPDGQRLLTASADNSIRVWNLSSAQLAQPPLVGHTDAIWDIEFVPGGQQLLSASSDRSLILWNLEPVQRLAHPLKVGTEPIWSVAFSGCGLVAGGGSLTLAEAYPVFLLPCDGSLSTEPEILTEHSAAVTSVAVSDQWLATGSVDRTVRLRKLPEKEPVISLDKHTSSVTSVAFCPDGAMLASADTGGTVILWKAEGDIWSLASTFTVPGGATSVACSPDGSLVAVGGQDHTVVLWDAQQQTGEAFSGHSDDVETVVFSPDGRILASGSRDNTIVLWDTLTRTPLRPALQGHTNWVTSLAFSTDGRILVSGSRDMTIILWDVETGQSFSPPLTAHSDWVTDVTFSLDGQFFASSGRDAQVFLWDINPIVWEQAACQIAHRNLTETEWQSLFRDETYNETCPSPNPAR